MPAKSRKRCAPPSTDGERKSKAARKEPRTFIRLIVNSAPPEETDDEDSDTSSDDGIDWEEPPNVFRLRPSTCNSTLLAKRAATNQAALGTSSSRSLIPTSCNTIDLVSPELGDFSSASSSRFSQASSDSGYCSASSTTFIHTSACSISKAQNAGTKTIDQYKRDMKHFTEKLFHRKFLTVEFPNDPKKARKALEPVMRRLLDRPEDRPLIPKVYVVLNFRDTKLSARTRLVRKPAARTRDMNTDSWVADYLSAPQGDWDR